MIVSFVSGFIISNIFLALFITIILVVRNISKHWITPNYQYGVGVIALISCVVPFIPIGTENIRERIAKAVWQKRTSETTPGSATLDNTGTDTINTTEVIDYVTDSSNFTTLYIILGGIILIGIVVMLLRLANSLIKVNQLKKSMSKIEDEATMQVFLDAGREISTNNKAKLYQCINIRSPISLGVFKRVVIVPKNIEMESQIKKKYVFMHELLHFRRGHLVMNNVIALFHILYWFNPVVIILLKRLREDMEMDCDYAVLKLLREEESYNYGTIILDYALKHKKEHLPLTSGISNTKSAIRNRIEKISNYEPATIKTKRKNNLVLFTVVLISLIMTPLLSANASNNEKFTIENERITEADLEKYFEGRKGSFVLYNPQEDKYIASNKQEILLRHVPNSTYKIYSALAALENESISPNYNVLEWKGEKERYETWESDQNLVSAMAKSVNWYFERLDEKVGEESLKAFYQEIKYGNEDVKGVGHTLMNDTLKISPMEQVQLLHNLHINEFKMDNDNIETVMESILLETKENKELYGKTGTGSLDGNTPSNGWFIGLVDNGSQQYYFATYVEGKDAAGSDAHRISLEILNEMNIYQ